MLDTVGVGAGAELVVGAGAGAELGGASVGDGDELFEAEELDGLEELEGLGEGEPLPDGLAAAPACAVGCAPGAARVTVVGCSWPSGVTTPMRAAQPDRAGGSAAKYRSNHANLF